MDGPELVKFSLDVVPPLVDRVLAGAKWTRDNVDMYLLHQATLFMLEHLRERLSLDREHTPEALEQYGNTVSSTIPILIHDLRRSGRLTARQADRVGRFRRRAVLGRLRVDRNLVGPASASRPTRRSAGSR